MKVLEHRIEVAPGIALAAWLVDGRAEAGGTKQHSGPAAFLLVHGLASNARLWDATALELASRGHVVGAVDLRGHGESDKPDEGYDFETMVADVVKVSEFLGLERPILVGQSMGANLVLDMAWRDPQTSRGIVGVDGGTIELSRGFPRWEDAAKALAPPELIGTPASAIVDMLRKTHPTWPETGIASTMANFEIRADGTVAPRLSRANHMKVLRSLWEDSPATKFSTLRVPALFVFAGGAAGPPGRREAAAEASDAVLVVQVVWFKDADHDIHAQFPVELADLLDAQVRSGFFGADEAMLAGD
jgi:pimeloyl-ACP methyl ester carboxylesterase